MAHGLYCNSIFASQANHSLVHFVQDLQPIPFASVQRDDLLCHSAPLEMEAVLAVRDRALVFGVGVIWDGIPFETPVIPAKAGIQSVDRALPKVC
jgi:hypothetical protein